MFDITMIIGRVGRDAVKRYTPDGVAVTNFSVAVTDSLPKKSKEGDRKCPIGWKENYNGSRWEVTKWYHVVAWRELADIAESYVKKGCIVFVQGNMTGKCEDGSMNPNIWTAAAGIARASFDLQAKVVKVLSGPADGSENTPPESPELDDEPIPF